MQIFAKSKDGKVVAFEVVNSDTVLYIKKKIEEKLGITTDKQMLLYKGRDLEECKTVDQCRITEKSVINIIVILRQIQIFVKKLDSTETSLEIIKSDTLLNLKNIIQAYMEILVKDQILIYNDKILEDDNKTVEEYNIVEKSVINVVNKLRGGLMIFLNTMNGKTLPLEVIKSDTVLDIKKKIEEMMKLSVNEQILLHNDKVLKDNKTVSESMIVENSVINIIIVFRKKKIFIKDKTGDTVTLEITKMDTIWDIKMMIQENMKPKIGEQKLVYQGAILEDNKTVEEYNIAEKSVMYILPRYSDGMRVFAKTMDGKTAALKVMKSDTIFNIKNIIGSKIGLTPDEQKIVYQGAILEDDKTAEECQIVEKSVINVVARLRGGPKIFAKTMDGKTVGFEVTKSYSILNIQKMIQEKIGLTPEEQRLVYQGRILEDDKTVEECQIDAGSVIHIVVRLRGRPQIVVKSLNNGKSISFDFTKSDTILNIKKKIEEELKLTIADQILIYNDKILEDDNKTVEEYNIADNYKINVVTRLRPQIVVKSLKNGKTISFGVTKSDTILSIKKKIQEKMELMVGEQILILNDELLEDNNKTVEEYNIVNNSVINVVV